MRSKLYKKASYPFSGSLAVVAARWACWWLSWNREETKRTFRMGRQIL
jgi:hypothetical protein